MRAGLLSENTVIRLIKDNFVSTWVLIDDLKTQTDAGNRFADTLAENWEYPLDLMYFSADGTFRAKLNSFRDLPPAHPDVGGHDHPLRRPGSPHANVFLSYTRRFLQTRWD